MITVIQVQQAGQCSVSRMKSKSNWISQIYSRQFQIFIFQMCTNLVRTCTCHTILIFLFRIAHHQMLFRIE